MHFPQRKKEQEHQTILLSHCHFLYNLNNYIYLGLNNGRTKFKEIHTYKKLKIFKLFTLPFIFVLQYLSVPTKTEQNKGSLCSYNNSNDNCEVSLLYYLRMFNLPHRKIRDNKINETKQS